jgi:hypothetical protein
MVSGTISLPSPGFFSPFPHGTSPLSVARKYLALRGGPRRFTRNILRATWEHQAEVRSVFVQGALTLCGPAFQLCSTNRRFCNFSSVPVDRNMGPTTPTQQRHRAITLHRFRLDPFRSPLLRVSLLLSFPQSTEMFQFPCLPHLVLCVQTRVTGHDPGRVSPFGHPRINAYLTASRGLSQPATSFIGFWRQGIHH